MVPFEVKAISGMFWLQGPEIKVDIELLLKLISRISGEEESEMSMFPVSG